jgi:cytochrome P450
MMNNPDLYKDPKRFIPERFLGANPERDPREIVFGFGRRY